MTRKKYIKYVQAMGFTDIRGARRLAVKFNQAGFSYHDAFMATAKVYASILVSELMTRLEARMREDNHESD